MNLTNNQQAKKFMEFETRLGVQMHDSFEKLLPMLQTLSGAGLGGQQSDNFNASYSERILNLEKAVNVLKSYKGWNTNGSKAIEVELSAPPQPMMSMVRQQSPKIPHSINQQDSGQF